MSFRTRHLVLIIFVKIFFGFYSLIAQETEYFAGKPDENIKRVLMYEVDNKQDTVYLNRVIEFNKTDRLLKMNNLIIIFI
ncbi:MAG: hypothetical protein HC831_11895 [Chloroflexia bacterium]|nr:hypothetical protein [Chloroflexia bacterium]